MDTTGQENRLSGLDKSNGNEIEKIINPLYFEPNSGILSQLLLNRYFSILQSLTPRSDQES